MAPASHGLLARIQRANDDAAHRFGPHTAEVEAFIVAAAQLTPWQWRQVLTIRRLIGTVSKDAARGDTARSIQAAIRSTETRISEPMARAGEVLFDALAKKSDDKQLAAWDAMTAVVMRSQLPALKFAVHYAPFAALIPVAGADVLDPRTRRLVDMLDDLTDSQVAGLATRWRIEHGASRALLQAVAKNRTVKSEEAVALAALTRLPQRLGGDEGWAAVRTLVHGGRVLGAVDDLSEAEIAELWAPLEPAIPYTSLNEDKPVPAAERVRAAVTNAIGTITRPPRSRGASSMAVKPAAAYGPNHTEVANFIKGLGELSPIQWLRILDRRKLVESVTREGAAEPAGVVRSILAALQGTRDLDMFTRCRAFAAVSVRALRSSHAAVFRSIRCGRRSSRSTPRSRSRASTAAASRTRSRSWASRSGSASRRLRPKPAKRRWRRWSTPARRSSISSGHAPTTKRSRPGTRSRPSSTATS